MNEPITYYAPASVGNLSVGFDLLGLALEPLDGSYFGDRVTVGAAKPGDQMLQLSFNGQYASALPSDPVENVVTKCLDLFRTELEMPACPELSIQLTKSLPIGSGLGSSASSIVAALAAINQWFDNPLDANGLLDLMSKAECGVSGEKHFDNIAPSYFGGLVLCESLDEPPQFLFWPDAWQIIVAYRNTEVKTKDARNVLPNSYPRSVLVSQAASLARFVHGLGSGDLELAARNIVDLVAEPYREQLLPDFSLAKHHALQHGALAAGISGSGPTMFAVVDHAEKANELADWLSHHYARDGFVKLCTVDRIGARQLTGVNREVH